jgi:hypothetical protein
VLYQPEPRAALLRELDGAQRLVLLGDALELRHGPLREALTLAGPVLRELGETLGSGGEVVIVPGNHDHMLLSGWFARRALSSDPAPLGLQSEVDWRPGELLESVVRSLGPVDVRIEYPGVWLRDDIYATHGHYGDRHNSAPIIERIGAGLMARLIPERDGGPREAEDYESALRPMYAWIEAVAQGRVVAPPGGHNSIQVDMWRHLAGPERRLTIRRAGIRAGFPVLIAALNRAGIGPFGADVSGPELRRGGLRGFAEVLRRLSIDAPHVLFGHTHRAGPLPGDEADEWIAPTGARMMNVGSWVLERSFLGSAPASSPYRPGFCAIVDGGRPPAVRNLMDEVTEPSRA